MGGTAGRRPLIACDAGRPMPQDLFPNPWLVNTLLNPGFVDQKMGELAERPVPCDLSNWLAAHFDALQLSKGKEAQLEDKLIGPLLAQQGWATVNQQSFIVQGKPAKPGWCLLLDASQVRTARRLMYACT